MRVTLSELVCCPACRHFPLELSVVESTEGSPDEVETGYFLCPDCRRFYFISEGIPRFLTEDFASLIDVGFTERVPAHALEEHREDLDRFLALLAAGEPGSETAAWGIEDVAFWEDEYSTTTRQDSMLARVERSRADAGERTYPREQTIFSRLRPRLEGGGVLLDMGCGYSQTVRTLCHPAKVDYRYVGCDLALSPLRLGRKTLPGDFVQCSVEAPPFRRECADGLIMLGTLHHLSDPERALGLGLETVRPGGVIGFHEVIRRGTAKRLGPLLSDEESAHNEAIDWPQIRDRAARDVTAGTVRFGSSPVRVLLSRWLAERMRSSPPLTRAVFALDALCLNTLGRWWPLFGPREVLMFAVKGTGAVAASPASAEASPSQA